MGGLAGPVGFDAADRLAGGPPDGAGVVAAQVDGHSVLSDVDGDDAPGMDPAEGDLLPDDHDDAGIAGPALDGDRLRGGPPSLAGQLIVSCLVPIALWLWMARANGLGRNWARNLSTVLFLLATLDLTGAFGTPVVQLRLVPVIFGPAIPVLTWLISLAAVWLLYRPASTAYFQPHGLTHAGHSA